MKKTIVLLTAVMLFIGAENFVAAGDNTLGRQKDEPISAALITSFYFSSLEKTENKKCYRDYTFSKDENYYCLTYNKNEKNKLRGKDNCTKDGVCTSETEDIYTFNKNGKLVSYLYWYENGGYKLVEVKYTYYRNGRIKKEKEKDNATSKILGDTIVTYKYKGDTQTKKVVERKLDFPPIFKKENVLETKINECRAINCYFAQSFLPELEP